jgi:2'-5' RNA ligase
VLPADVTGRLATWQREAFGGARDVRIVPRGNLHITLAFLGPRPADDVPRVAEALGAAAAAARPPVLSAVRYRETRSVGMLVLSDDEGRASAFAVDLHARLERAGLYTPEARQWLPHLTVLRFRRPPRLAPEPPDFGSIVPSEAAVYHSLLRRSGAQYEIVESVALGGSG